MSINITESLRALVNTHIRVLAPCNGGVWPFGELALNELTRLQFLKPVIQSTFQITRDRVHD